MKTPKVIRFNGEDLKVEGGYRIRGEQYWVVGVHSQTPRQSLRVLKQLSKRRHEEKVIHRFADEGESWKLIERIKEFQKSRMPFPKIEAIKRETNEILVVREFVEGRSLRHHLRTKKELSVFQAIRFYRQLVEQIFFLHRATGIVHGDLAPENAIVSTSGTAITLIDFGSSFRFAESANPDIGDGFRETYQAPETLGGEPLSRSSEQFSAASIFYEMLTRKAPFNVAAKREFRTRPPVLTPASEQAVSTQVVPSSLWTLIDRHLTTALSLDADKRFDTIGQWHDSARELWLKAKHPELLELESRNRSLWHRLRDLFTQ